MLQTAVRITVTFIIAMYLPLLISLFLHIALSYCVVFHFTLQDSFQHFLLDRASGNAFSQLLFIWECHYFSLIFEVQFYWTYESWLNFILQCFEYIGLHSFW